MTEIVIYNGFYTYPWQNRLAEAKAFIEYCGYRMGAEIGVGDNDLRLDVILPPGISELAAREKFLEANLSPCTLYLQTPARDVVTPPAPPELPWYAKLAIGTRLKVVRAGGLDVYTHYRLMTVWSRRRMPMGDDSMKLAAPYDSALDPPPPTPVLCVLNPNSAFPGGLWIAAMGNDGKPNVESVTP